MVEGLEGAELNVSLLNTSCKPTPLSSQVILIDTLLSFIALLTVTLNLLVIISISHFRQLHTSTNFLLLSLAVSDLLVGFLVMPFQIFSLHSCWSKSAITCNVFIYLGFVLTCASVGTMVLISLDRYVAICNPLRYSYIITPSRAQMCVCMCWCLSVFYNIGILKDQLLQAQLSNNECVIVISYIAGSVDIILAFICPVTVMIVLYVRVFVVAVAQARIMRFQITVVKLNTVVATVKKSEIKAARTLSVLLVVFLICLSPYYLLSLGGQDTTTNAASVETWLFCCNSTMNPLIYSFFYPWFRKAVKLIVSLHILQPGSCEANMM
ncbi:trace amine-associated receptor 13c-like [Genypterus blacodes]|uniref:trace amine-associated receptor 13c-like n=1 Tax=Genypterus blacodes TaxID=154954 RepID=UPI003F773F7C